MSDNPLPLPDKRQTIVLAPKLNLIVLDPIGNGHAASPIPRAGNPPAP